MHSLGIHFSTQDTWDIVEWHSYRAPPSLFVSRNILLQKTMKPLPSKFVGTCISTFKTIFSCSMFTWFTSFLHIFFSKFFPCRGLPDRSSPIHNLEYSVSKPKQLGTVDCGKAYYFTFSNYAGNLTVIKTEAKRWVFAKKGLPPRI